MSQPTYRVESRRGRSGLRYAVIRTGPKGGTKVISVWINESIAHRVAEMLNCYAGTEA